MSTGIADGDGEAFDDGRGYGAPGGDLRNQQDAQEAILANTELGFDVAVNEPLEAAGIYDATRLKARKPELYRACIKMLGAGVSNKKVAQLLGLDIRTVIAVATDAEAQGAIPPYKERTLHQLRAIVTLALDMLVERAAAGLLSPLDVAVLIDKIELLSGGATARLEIKISAEEEESLRFFSDLRNKAQGMVYEVEILPQTGELPEPREQPALPIMPPPADGVDWPENGGQTNNNAGGMDSQSIDPES